MFDKIEGSYKEDMNAAIRRGNIRHGHFPAAATAAAHAKRTSPWARAAAISRYRTQGLRGSESCDEKPPLCKCSPLSRKESGEPFLCAEEGQRFDGAGDAFVGKTYRCGRVTVQKGGIKRKLPIHTFSVCRCACSRSSRDTRSAGGRSGIKAA